MCWKRHEEPRPSPTAMAILVSTMEESQNLANVTQGGTACPELTTPCSNSTSFKFECHNGFCCDYNDQQLCSCMPGWSGTQCDIQPIGFFPSSLTEASANQLLIIGVLIGVVLLGLLIIAVFIYRKKNQRNNFNPNEQELLRVKHEGERTTPPSQKERRINGSDTAAS